MNTLSTRLVHGRRMRPVRRALFRLSKWRHRGVFAVDIDNSYSGFFAQLNWCLYVFAYCQSNGLTPSIRLLGNLYTNQAQHDWLHDYFEDVTVLKGSHSGLARQRPLRIDHIEQTDLAETSAPMTLERANRLLTTYLQVRKPVLEHVDSFVSTHFTPGCTLGVHFRGTDKSREADPVPWDEFAHAIHRYTSCHPMVETLFVASDDPEFIRWMEQKCCGRLRVVSHGDQESSNGDLPIHLNLGGDRQRKGFEALVNCLLLSRCNALLRSASFLSGWSNVFNPELPVTLLNRPHEATLWFPDSEVLKRSDRSFLNQG